MKEFIYKSEFSDYRPAQLFRMNFVCDRYFSRILLKLSRNFPF